MPSEHAGPVEHTGPPDRSTSASGATAASYRAVGALVAQLHLGGVGHVVISPGSRSTPLTLAFLSSGKVTPWLHFDERSAGYFALGLARQLAEPVALVCTSGTAAANLLPAVVEASLSRVPLVVLTADRPPELRDVGANQTIDQGGIFGRHAKWAVELPVADGSSNFEAHAAGVGARAASIAAASPAGPVHLNVPLREPLIEAGWQDALPVEARSLRRIEIEGASEGAAEGPVERAARRVAASLLAAVAGRRGLIVCGPESAGLPARAIAELAAELDWPILADPLSGLRAGRHALGHVVETYDTLLRSPRFASAARPEAVVRFGAAPTSKVLGQFLAASRGIPHVLVDAAGGWRDPDALATHVLHVEPTALCAATSEALRAARPTTFTGAADDPAGAGSGPRTDPSWRALWGAANRVAGSALREACDGFDEPFEGQAPRWLAAALPEGATLVVGNSLAVRDVDAFFPTVGRELRIVGTRGASGIDGVVSTAVGAAAATKAKRAGPVALLVGDLSLLHDLNGLWPLRRHELSLTIVLVNNDGGGIFHFLPQAEEASDYFEQWFATPAGIDFRAAVELHGGRFEQLAAGGEEDAIRAALARPGLDVLELRTDRWSNVEQHRQVWQRVDRALAEAAGGDADLASLVDSGAAPATAPATPARG